jgi:hypothetical protein
VIGLFHQFWPQADLLPEGQTVYPVGAGLLVKVRISKNRLPSRTPAVKRLSAPWPHHREDLTDNIPAQSIDIQQIFDNIMLRTKGRRTVNPSTLSSKAGIGCRQLPACPNTTRM